MEILLTGCWKYLVKTDQITKPAVKKQMPRVEKYSSGIVSLNRRRNI